MPIPRYKCCCDGPACEKDSFRYVPIEPIMFPDKFMQHQGEYSPDKPLTFWVRYRTQCEENEVVIKQNNVTGADDDRVIRLDDTQTIFMTDLGPTDDPNTQSTRIGMTRPGDNATARVTYFYGSASRLEDNMAQDTGAFGFPFNNWHRNAFRLTTLSVGSPPDSGTPESET